MTVVDIVIKILLFFLVFYGAIMLTAVISKNDEKKDTSDKEIP